MYTYEIIGGILIGVASVLPLALEGRIAGISGYAASSTRPRSSLDSRHSLYFVLGLIASGWLWKTFSDTSPLPLPPLDHWQWVAAGLLVGFGSRLSGGCTSGHGVCGLGRASKRSFVSVLIFMAVAALTVFLRGVLS